MGIVEEIFQNSEFLGFVVGVMKVFVLMADDAASQNVFFPTNRDNVLNTLWTGDADLRLYVTTVQDG